LDKGYFCPTFRGHCKTDQLAANLLIPLKSYQEFTRRGSFPIDKIREFATTMGVPPFIVIGRLQKEGLLSYSAYTEERVNYNLEVIA
jgi:HTH-type transcriptional regulator/antitoxin HigA